MMSSQNETLTLLHDAVAAFAKPDGARIRGLRGTPLGYDRATWKRMAEQGWLSILVGEADGGLALGVEAACVVAERLGYGASREPFAAAGVMVPRLVGQSDNAGLKARILPRLLEGEIVAALAWQSEAGGLSPQATGVTVRPSASGGVQLSGTSGFVPVPDADAHVVLAKGADGLSLHWVERGAKGLESRKQPAADGGWITWLTLRDVSCVADSCLAAGPAVEAMVEDALDAALVAIAAELVGNMERALEMTLEYLRTRKQFGQAIGSFQALQHRAVDIWMLKELARHAVTAAARLADDPATAPRARAAAASGAKYRAADAALTLAKQAIQLHGAIGFTDEYDLGLYVNRAVVLSSFLGTVSDHRKRFGAAAQVRERTQ